MKVTWWVRLRGLASQALLFVLVYLALQVWLQRDMLSGSATLGNMVDLDGQVISASDFNGQPYMLHFWASWCPICELEQGAISSVAGDWPVVTVAMQSGGDSEVRDYLTKHSLQWRTVADDDGTLSAQFGVSAVPATFIVGPDGNIKFKERGLSSAWGLKLRLWLAK